MTQSIVHYIEEGIIVYKQTSEQCIDSLKNPKEEEDINLSHLIDAEDIVLFQKDLEDALKDNSFIGILIDDGVDLIALEQEYELGEEIDSEKEFIEGMSEQ